MMIASDQGHARRKIARDMFRSHPVMETSRSFYAQLQKCNQRGVAPPRFRELARPGYSSELRKTDFFSFKVLALLEKTWQTSRKFPLCL
jgi:hypothetical protein